MKQLARAALVGWFLSGSPLLAGPAQPPEIDGLWFGTLKSGPLALRLALHLQSKGGKLTGTFDSLDQKAPGTPLAAVEFKNGKLTFQLESWGASYEAKLDATSTGLHGEFRQKGASYSLKFKKVDKLPELARPQEPKRPFPYQEIPITYRNEKADITFAGTLTLPPGDGPFPAVVLLSGTGPLDRDSTHAYHKPFLVLADHLTRQGIAVLRVDDRGIGETKGGNVWQSTLPDFAEDALLAVAFLKNRQEVNPAKIGLIGHSQGALVAPLAASQAKDVAFIVLLGTPCLAGEALMNQVLRTFWQQIGVDKAKVPEIQKLLDGIHKIVREEKDPAKGAAALRAFFKEVLAKQPGFAKLSEKEQNAWFAEVEADVQFHNSAWYRYVLSYDPRPILAKVQCPVLALTGALDVQVPAKDNLPQLEKALRAGGNKDFTVKKLPDLNHLFQTAGGVSPQDSALIEETFAPVAVQLISEWILKRK
jgi:pimeloyl-ACP methyl ester carboxylesterase